VSKRAVSSSSAAALPPPLTVVGPPALRKWLRSFARIEVHILKRTLYSDCARLVLSIVTALVCAN
jgi:hypothetical protein